VVSEPVSKDWFDVSFYLLPDLSVRFSLALLLSLLLDVLHLALDVLLLPILAHNCLKCRRVVDPLDQSSIAAQWNDGKCAQTQPPLAGLWIIFQHLVAKARKLNEALFLAQIAILIALEQEVVHILVSTYDAELLWLLLAVHDGHFLSEGRNHDWICLVGWKFLQVLLDLIDFINCVAAQSVN